MATDDLLRLAWEADHDGRPKLRDALITLAVVEADDAADWPERARLRLVDEHPGHFLAAYPSARLAREDPGVLAKAAHLRVKYPAIRVDWLLTGARASRGPYLGRVESIPAMIDDLFGQPAEAENVRKDLPQPSRGPLIRQRSSRPVLSSLAYPGPTGWAGEPDEPETPVEAESIARFYLRVLITVAILLEIVQQEAAVNDRAGG